MKTWSEPLTRTSVTPGSFRSGSSGPAPNCAAATTPRYRVPLSRSQRDLRLAWLWPRQLVNTAGRDPLDRVEVCPSVRGEGRLVDRSIKVQALGRGARVQSFAETAQSPWTDSAFAHWWAAKWIASPSDFASTVSCCWWMPDIACAVGGTAVITVRPWSPSRISQSSLADRRGTFLGIQGTSERGRVLAPWPTDPRSFAVDHLASSAHPGCSVGWGGIHDRSQRVSQRRHAGRLPIRADPETIHRSVVQPVTRLVAIGRRSQDQQRQEHHVRLHEFDQGIATASRSAPRFAVAGIGGNGCNSCLIRGWYASTSDPVAARTHLGPKLATAAFIVFGEHPTTGLPSTRAFQRDSSPRRSERGFQGKRMLANVGER